MLEAQGQGAIRRGRFHQALAPLGVTRVAPVPRTLEQVFLGLTGSALRDGEPE